MAAGAGWLLSWSWPWRRLRFRRGPGWRPALAWSSFGARPGLLLCSASAPLAPRCAVWPRSDPSRWARGAAGESGHRRHPGEAYRGRRWVVLHDLALPGSRANVDHLVIGPTGVWVVDTKAYRAPGRSPAAPGPRGRRSHADGCGVLGGRGRVGVARRGRPARNSHARQGVAPSGPASERGQGVAGRPARRRLRRGQHLWPRLGRRGVRELGQLAEQSLDAGVVSESEVGAEVERLRLVRRKGACAGRCARRVTVRPRAACAQAVRPPGRRGS